MLRSLVGSEMCIRDRNKILDKLYNDKVILDHGLKVAQELAHVLSGGDTLSLIHI